jgi:hypothetical protein
LNKLKKRCLAEFFTAHPDTHKTQEELGAKFDKKISKKKYKIVKVGAYSSQVGRLPPVFFFRQNTPPGPLTRTLNTFRIKRPQLTQTKFFCKLGKKNSSCFWMILNTFERFIVIFFFPSFRFL